MTSKFTRKRLIIGFVFIFAIAVLSAVSWQSQAQRNKAPLAPTVTGATESRVIVTDSGGDSKADPGDVIEYTVTIDNTTGVELSNVQLTSPLSAEETLLSTNIGPVVRNDLYAATGNVRIQVPVANGVLANDVDPDGTLTTITAFDATSVNGGAVTMATSGPNVGAFTYDPPAGFEGTGLTADSFTYTVSDGTLTATATVKIDVSGMVWFIDANSASDGNGRLTSPFKFLASFAAINDGVDNVPAHSFHPGNNDNIFFYESVTSYTGPVTLRSGQKVIGQDSSASLASVTGITPTTFGDAFPTMNSGNGTFATITSSAGGILLNSGNLFRGFSMSGTAGTAIQGVNFGTLSVAEVNVSSNAQALSLTTGTLSGPTSSTAAFGTLSSGGGTNGVLLSGISGTMTAGSGTLTGTASGPTFNVIGGTVSATYSGGITQTANNAAVSVTGGHQTGTITFNTGTINATNGTGLQFDNADGTYNFNGATTLNGGDAGVDLLNGSTGTFNFGTGAEITNPSGTGFNINASNANGTFSGTINDNSGFAIDVDGHDGGTYTFDTEATNSTGTGIRVINSNGGAINFNSPTKTLNTGANTAVTLTDNSGGAINFGGGGLDIDTVAGTGFAATTTNATNAGTITITGANNTVQTATGRVLNWSSAPIGASGVAFTSLTATGTVANDAILLDDVDGAGNTFNGGTVNIAATSGATRDGMRISAGSTATFTFASYTCSGAGDDCFDTGGVNGPVTFTTVNLSGATGAGMELNPADGGGAININGGTITAASGGIGVDVNDGNSTINVAATINKTTTGNVVQVSSRSGGTVDFSGAITAGTSITPVAGTGIDMTNNTGGTVRFDGGVALFTSTTTAFNSTASTGGTVEVCDEAVCNAGATGALVNTLTTTTGTALNVANTTIGANNLEFRSISSTGVGTANGIVLDATGSSGGLRIKGTGSAPSGGTIANKNSGAIADSAYATQGTGIYLNNTANVRIAGMQLNDFDNSAIRGFSVAGFVFEDSVISGAVGDNSGPIEGAIAFGDILATGTFGLSGSSLIDNVNVSGSIEHHLEFYNQTGTLNLTISNSNIHDNSVASGSDGIQMEFRGTAQVFTNIDTNSFSNNKSQAIQISTLEDSNLHATIQSNTITRGTQGNEGILLQNGGNSDITALIGGPNAADGNTISGFGGTAIFAGQVAGQGTATSLLQATIQRNTVTSPTSATNHSIIVFLSSLTGQVSQARIRIDNNAVTQNSTIGTARAIIVDPPDTGRTPEYHATITNNNVNETDGAAGVTPLVAQARNGATGHFDVRNNIGTNATGGAIVRVREDSTGGASTAELARNGNASNDPAVVLAANNPGEVTELLGPVAVINDGIIQLPATPTAPTLPSGPAEADLGSLGARGQVLDTSSALSTTLDLSKDSRGWEEFEPIVIGNVTATGEVRATDSARPAAMMEVSATAETAIVVPHAAKTNYSALISEIAYKVWENIEPRAYAFSGSVSTTQFAIPAGATVTIKFRTQVVNGPFDEGVDTLANQSTITGSPSINILTNTVTTPLDAAPDLSAVSLDDSSTQTQPGMSRTYTVTYRNVNTDVHAQGASGVILTVGIPTNATYDSGATPGWTCGASTCTKSIVGDIAADNVDRTTTIAFKSNAGLGQSDLQVVVPTVSVAETTATHDNGTDLNSGNNSVTNPDADDVVGVWLGGTSSDWGTAANWSNGVQPASPQNISVPAGAGSSPTISAATSVNGMVIAKDVTIDNGITLTVNEILDLGASKILKGTNGATGMVELAATTGATPMGQITRSTGQVNVTLKKNFSAAGNAPVEGEAQQSDTPSDPSAPEAGPFLFPVGFGTNYTPLTLTSFTTTGGSLAVTAISGPAPGMTANKALQMYWQTIATGSITAANLQFDYGSDTLEWTPITNPRVIHFPNSGAVQISGTNGCSAAPCADTGANNRLLVNGVSSFDKWWTAGESTAAPTAAGVSVSGRILTPSGRGVAGANVSITGTNGTTRTVVTNRLGFYCLDDIDVGKVYVVSVVSSRYRFTPRQLMLNDALGDIDFVAEP